ncbi:hypothetical protein Vretimale_12691 [Volvox reticuliferus]|uniref:Uncharacterized protein n=1 Tax=Volvox reticuliferus TaxID=1737510 RepID=A0A8J4LSZ7_9CHLO|nr:hypothetical protein Vretimale_12691 [Volvox reticuliferus]
MLSAAMTRARLGAMRAEQLLLQFCCSSTDQRTTSPAVPAPQTQTPRSNPPMVPTTAAPSGDVVGIIAYSHLWGLGRGLLGVRVLVVRLLAPAPNPTPIPLPSPPFPDQDDDDLRRSPFRWSQVGQRRQRQQGGGGPMIAPGDDWDGDDEKDEEIGGNGKDGEQAEEGSEGWQGRQKRSQEQVLGELAKFM